MFTPHTHDLSLGLGESATVNFTRMGGGGDVQVNLSCPLCMAWKMIDPDILSLTYKAPRKPPEYVAESGAAGWLNTQVVTLTDQEGNEQLLTICVAISTTKQTEAK
jgi:hypothetical protein